METTFMTIHNLTPDANILYASESIVDILGYRPDEVAGKSCFDYFHPDEVPFARHIHSRGVMLDKAAVLAYARIKNRNQEWIGCECVFTVVYEVLVACTSIYRGDAKSERRAVQAPAIRRLFASSPRDPRYHMLEHLSYKFRTPPQESLLEPRAALILNRFTRTLTVIYATNAVSSILGVTPEQFKGKSFYECIQENCLAEAIRCLESAKANDSIAYLRFWYRDPRREEDLEQEMLEASQSSDSEDGGVALDTNMDIDPDIPANDDSVLGLASSSNKSHSSSPRINWISSGESNDLDRNTSAPIIDQHNETSSNSSLILLNPEQNRQRRRIQIPRPAVEPDELEAVVSCTSDGLVVVLRRARPPIPSLQQPRQPAPFANGLFAAPWGANPIRPHQYQPDPHSLFRHGFQAPSVPAGGPNLDEFMNSIRDVAVFAWSLVGINGNIASYGHGMPRGEAQPPNGLPIWDPYSKLSQGFPPPENQAAQRWARLLEAGIEPVEGNMEQYQHRRQEDSGPQNGYGLLMRSGHQPSPSFALTQNQTDDSHQPGVRDTVYNVQGQSGWASNPHSPALNGPRSTMAPNFQDPSEGSNGDWYQ